MRGKIRNLLDDDNHQNICYQDLHWGGDPDDWRVNAPAFANNPVHHYAYQ